MSSKGFANIYLIIIIILLIAIPVGLYLVSNPQIFNSNASYTSPALSTNSYQQQPLTKNSNSQMQTPKTPANTSSSSNIDSDLGSLDNSLNQADTNRDDLSGL